MKTPEEVLDEMEKMNLQPLYDVFGQIERYRVISPDKSKLISGYRELLALHKVRKYAHGNGCDECGQFIYDSTTCPTVAIITKALSE